jgi:CDP-paratose 2-epimerase
MKKPRRGGPLVALVTGGAGFIGVNLADRLARSGRRVLVYDNLCRPGVEQNLEWLCRTHGEKIKFMREDVRNRNALAQVVAGVGQVFHCAGQVAVTTSVEEPAADFEVNARGTLNVLEAVRACPEPPPLLFTSTNKVYGRLSGLDFEEGARRYAPREPEVGRRGIDESRPLDFYSPYGCSKGAADQYVLDYARIYDLPTVVFRMSCIYGPHQHGTEDQGWVAHFLIRALQNRPITLYGNGKQVRDILHVDDLLDAFLLAMEHMETIRGRAFNIGGGPANAISLFDLLESIRDVQGHPPAIEFGPWRAGDQLYYVSDSGAFQQATGWRPRIGMEEGVARLSAHLAERGAIMAGLRESAAAMV